MNTMNLERLANQVTALIDHAERVSLENQALKKQLLLRAEQCESLELRNHAVSSKVREILTRLKEGAVNA